MSNGPDRIWRTDIKPYNQVLALTQHMINQGISNLYTRLETGEDGVKMPEPAECYADENNYIQGVVFGAPAVVIQADYTNLKSVQFQMRMKSGEMQVRRMKGRDEKTKKFRYQKLTLDINDWKVTVPVDLGFTKVDPDTTRGKAIVDRSAAKGNPNHSIFELLLDLSSMSESNASWEFGEWSEDDWYVDENNQKSRPNGWEIGKPRKFTDLEQEFQVSMNYYIRQISSQLMETNLNSMGFAVMAEDANKRATFEVNHVRYMTYPWTDPQSNTPATPSYSGNGRLNYLLYLETVGSNTPPSESDASSVLSSRMGNWTEGRNPGVDAPSRFGSFVLSSEFFMEKFLLPKLSCINRIMAIDIYEVSAWCDDKVFSQPFSVSARYGIGLGDASKDETEFRLKKETALALQNDWHDGAKNFLRPLTESVGSGSNVWSYQDVEWASTAKHAYKHVGSVEVWMHGDTITFSRAYTKAGSNQIIYEGRTWTKFEFKVDPSILLSNKYGTLITEVSWKIVFTLSEVTDGGLKIKVDAEQPSVNCPSSAGELNDIATSLGAGYLTGFKNFEYYCNSIRNSLEGQEKFTLPASGVFYFKNPVMDSRANLICELEYNGNPKLGNINPDTSEERVRRAEADFVNMPAVKTTEVSGVCEKK